jgi:perosamine synthetase
MSRPSMTSIKITHPCFGPEELALVEQCLRSGWVTQGPFVDQFEALFTRRHHARHALATTSCTAALHLAGLALNLAPGDEVLVPAFTWITSAHTAEYSGAKAVFVDVDLATYNLDPEKLESAVTPRTKAIVAVHLFGLAAPMAAVMAVARKHQLAVVEDAACAVGSTSQGEPVGALGDIGCFSFHPRKVITTGEGGMLTTNRTDLFENLKSLRNHGATGVPLGEDSSKPYTLAAFDRLGFNLRMSDIQAAVGVAQMARLDGLLAERRACAHRYDALLAPLGAQGDLVLPIEPVGDLHSYQSYVVRVTEGGHPRRNRAMDHLASVGIQTRPGTHAAHRLGYFRDKYGIRAEAFPNACVAEDTTITLPIFPGMTQADSERISQQLAAGLAQSR